MEPNQYSFKLHKSPDSVWFTSWKLLFLFLNQKTTDVFLSNNGRVVPLSLDKSFYCKGSVDKYIYSSFLMCETCNRNKLGVKTLMYHSAMLWLLIRLLKINTRLNGIMHCMRLQVRQSQNAQQLSLFNDFINNSLPSLGKCFIQN